jgi:hypothetical protein
MKRIEFDYGDPKDEEIAFLGQRCDELEDSLCEIWNLSRPPLFVAKKIKSIHDIADEELRRSNFMEVDDEA